MEDDVKKNDSRKVLLGTFPSGKEIYLLRIKNSSVRRIGFSGGGEVPSDLQGGWSSVHLAKEAVDAYLAKAHGASQDAAPRVGAKSPVMPGTRTA